MRRCCWQEALIGLAWIATSVCLTAVTGLAQQPAPPEVEQERKAEALLTTWAAAKEYEVRVGGAQALAELRKEPVLRWSNPEVGDIYGNVFVWTRDGRPVALGSLFHWFAADGGAGTNRSTMEHELVSLAEEPIAATFHDKPVWKTREAGVKFAAVPTAPAPAASEAQRFSQLKGLAQQFTGFGKFGVNPSDQELRLLTQPIYRYAGSKNEPVTGGVFAYVRATDPEILLVLESRGMADEARWQFAAVRMHSRAEL